MLSALAVRSRILELAVQACLCFKNLGKSTSPFGNSARAFIFAPEGVQGSALLLGVRIQRAGMWLFRPQKPMGSVWMPAEGVGRL
jgi:hypothetical protein